MDDSRGYMLAEWLPGPEIFGPWWQVFGFSVLFGLAPFFGYFGIFRANFLKNLPKKGLVMPKIWLRLKESGICRYGSGILGVGGCSWGMGSFGPSVGSNRLELGSFSKYRTSCTFRGATPRVCGGVSAAVWSWRVIDPILEAGAMWLYHVPGLTE